MSALGSRACALSPTELLTLDMWAGALVPTFDRLPHLVGSVLTRRDYRDVDVRLILPDDDPILADPDRLRVVNVAMSMWAQNVTRLRVDFQFQSESEAQQHAGPRNALGARWSTVHSAPEPPCSTCGGSGKVDVPGHYGNLAPCPNCKTEETTDGE